MSPVAHTRADRFARFVEFHWDAAFDQMCRGGKSDWTAADHGHREILLQAHRRLHPLKVSSRRPRRAESP
jgi:hypothetical protein